MEALEEASLREQEQSRKVSRLNFSGICESRKWHGSSNLVGHGNTDPTASQIRQKLLEMSVTGNLALFSPKAGESDRDAESNHCRTVKKFEAIVRLKATGIDRPAEG